MPETSYGSKDYLQPAPLDITHDDQSHEKKAKEMEQLGAGLVQADSNVESRGVITQSSQKFHIRRNHEMMPCSAGIGSEVCHGYSRGQPIEASAGNDSIDHDKKAGKEAVAHHRHRSSISMTGPHICP